MAINLNHNHRQLSALDGAGELVFMAARKLSRINPDLLLVATAALLAISSFAFGERVAMRDGLGWDGEVYWTWVKDLPFEFREAGVDAYRIQRILPSSILYCVFRIFRIPGTVPNTLVGFAVINSISVSLVAYFWCLTANHFKISTRGKWLGFIGLFLNFAILKLSGYYVVLIDVHAFACASAMSYCYATRNRVGMWITTVIGAFLWPTMIFVGTTLSMFPRRLDLKDQDSSSCEDATEAVIDNSDAHAPFRLDLILAALIAYYSCVWCYFASSQLTMPLFGGLWPIRSVLGLSLFISTAYIFLGYRPLLDDPQLYKFSNWFPRTELVWMVCTILVMFGVKYFQTRFSNRPGYFGFNNHFLVVGITAVAKPGLFYLSHLIYFGPFWMLAAAFWPSICREIHRQKGIGLVLALMIGMGHSLGAESRHIIEFLPLLMPYAIITVERLALSSTQLGFLAAISVLTSKCWLYIGGPFHDNANIFPDQLFWMNVGAFMTDQTYVWQLACAVVCAFVMSLMLRPARPRLYA